MFLEDMRTLTIKNALTWTAYPVVMLVCIGLFMTFRGLGFALLACTSIPYFLRVIVDHCDKYNDAKLVG